VPATSKLDDSTPKYEILNGAGFYAENDTLYPQGTVIYYTGVPNEQMLPLNDPAKKAMDAYLDGLEQHHRRNLEERGLNPNTKRPRDLADALEVEKAADKKARVYAAEGGKVPQMGNLPGAEKKPDVVIQAAPAKPAERAKPIPILGAMNQT
jgi:hypothetical protein